MKNVLLACALGSAFVLTGCDTAEELKSTVTNALLNGTWQSDCAIEGADSYIAVGTFNNGKVDFESTQYVGSNTCDTNLTSSIENSSATYTIGKDVTVDGSVAGITTAVEVDMVDTTPGLSPAGEKSYNIFAIKDLNTLYVGDDTGSNNGTTAALRPTQLRDLKFTKQ